MSIKMEVKSKCVEIEWLDGHSEIFETVDSKLEPHILKLDLVCGGSRLIPIANTRWIAGL